jgi:hypothetical protein
MYGNKKIYPKLTMVSEKKLNFESREFTEKDKTILKVIITRHGPKASAAGEKDARAEYFDKSVKRGFKEMGIKSGEGLVHVSTSSQDRAVKTTKIHSEEISKTDHRTKDHEVERKSLETPYHPAQSEEEADEYTKDFNILVAMQKDLEPGIRLAVEKEHAAMSEEDQEAEIRNRIDMTVMTQLFKDVQADPSERKFSKSYEDLADRFGRRYFGFAKHARQLEQAKSIGGKQPEDEPYIQLDVTHSYPVMSFLKKYLVFEDGTRAEDLDPEEFFNRTGGVIRESQSIELEYIRSEDDSLKVKIKGEFVPEQDFNGYIDLENNFIQNVEEST